MNNIWTNSDTISFDCYDSIEDYTAFLDTLSKKYLNTNYLNTFTTDSENCIGLKDKMENLGVRVSELSDSDHYGTYIYNINGNKVLGSKWEQVYWIISPVKFDLA